MESKNMIKLSLTLNTNYIVNDSQYKSKYFITLIIRKSELIINIMTFFYPFITYKNIVTTKLKVLSILNII